MGEKIYTDSDKMEKLVKENEELRKKCNLEESKNQSLINVILKQADGQEEIIFVAENQELQEGTRDRKIKGSHKRFGRKAVNTVERS